MTSLRYSKYVNRFSINFQLSLIFFFLSLLTVPPQKIVISDESGAQLTSVVGPFSEGASFTLRCDVFGGKWDYWFSILFLFFCIFFYLNNKLKSRYSTLQILAQLFSLFLLNTKLLNSRYLICNSSKGNIIN